MTIKELYMLNRKEAKEFDNLTMVEKMKYIQERNKYFNHQGALRKAKRIHKGE